MAQFVIIPLKFAQNCGAEIYKVGGAQAIAALTYGTKTHLYLRGRALEDEDIDLSKKGWFSLLVNSWKRFETDEIKNVGLDIIFPNNKIIKVCIKQVLVFNVSPCVTHYLISLKCFSCTESKNKLINNVIKKLNVS